MTSRVAPAATAGHDGRGAPVFGAVDFFTDLFADQCRPSDHGDRRSVVPAPRPTPSSPICSGSARPVDEPPRPLEPFTVSGDDTAVEVDCTEGFCDTFSVRGERWPAESFLLNGVGIDGRLAVEGDRTRADRVSSSAFERVTVDELAVVIAIDAGEDLTDRLGGWPTSTRRGTASLPICPHRPSRRRSPPVGGHAVVLQFPTATLGGEVVLDLHDRVVGAAGRLPRRRRRAGYAVASSMCGIIAIVSRRPTRAAPSRRPDRRPGPGPGARR